MTTADKFLIEEFARCNVIVFGKKGTGKDLLMQHVINLRDEYHYSNIKYSRKSRPVKLKDISAGGNTYADLINGTVKKFKRPFEMYCDIYISDAGIYLPSQYQAELCKRYPGMPMYYALSRQLCRHNIHCNTQALGRIWDKLREQADSYINTVATSDDNQGNLIIDIIAYSDYQSAVSMLPPCPYKDKADREQYTAKYGSITAMSVAVPKSSITYNTFAFADKFIIEQRIQKIEITRRIAATM